MPKVCVIIPTLNRPVELARAISSALNQTYHDLEVIVVADELNAATEDVLNRLANPRLRHIANPKRVGLADARNIAVRATSAPWVAFLDDDDEWMPDKIEKQIAVAEKLTGDHVFVVSKFLERTADWERIWPETLPTGKDRFSEYMYFQRGVLLPSTFFVSRQLMVDIPFTSGLRYMEDIDWMLRVTSDPRTQLGVVDDALVVYNNIQGPGRLTYDTTWQLYYSWAVAQRKLFTPGAFSMLLVKTIAAKAREGKATWRELLHILSAALLLGSFSFKAVFYFFASVLFTQETKRKVREFFSSSARRARVIDTSKGQA